MSTGNVESQLLNDPIGQLELSDYCIVTADTRIVEVVERMRTMRQNCALVVGQGTQLIGVLTDRDVLFKVVDQPETWEQPVAQFISEATVTLTPDALTADALHMMEQNSFRNVPVIGERGNILGNVTHYSILKYLTDHFPETVYNLPPDLLNYASQRGGG